MTSRAELTAFPPSMSPGGPEAIEAGCPIADVRSLPLQERAVLLALARRLLDLVPNPSHARELVIAMLDVLESYRVDVEDAG